MSDELGEALARNSGPTVLKILVGSKLKALREKAGVTRDQAAYVIRGSEAKMSRLETGRTGFKMRDVVDLLQYYDVSDEAEREAVQALAAQANEPGWWQPYSDIMPSWFELYLGLEQAAAVIRSFELQYIPGLLQTEAYANSVIGVGRTDRAEDVERRVALRMRRQQLIEESFAPELWVVLDEAVLHRSMGAPDILREQLDHLLELTRRPLITVQILPFSRGGRVVTGSSPFTLLRFAERDLADVVYLEQLTSASYVDRREDVERYLEVIDRLGATALTPHQSRQMMAELRDSL